MPGPLEPVVVEQERDEPRDEREQRDEEHVVPRRRGGSAEEEDCHERRRSPKAKRTAVTCWNASQGQEAAEDGAERPESGRPQGEERRLRAVQRDVEGAWEGHQPRPGETRDEEEAEAGTRTLPEDGGSQQHDDQRLHLLQDEGVTASPRTNASVKRIVATADDPAPMMTPAAT